MTDRDRMQVYLEMSKESTKSFLEWFGNDTKEAFDVSDDEMLECWNSHFASTCKRFGLRP